MFGLDIQPPATVGGVIVWLIVLFVVTFLLGSIPWGVVISRLFYRKDIRDEGSGNIGTTNAMRSLGRVGGVAVFILDFVKGVVSGLLGWVVADYLAQASTSLGFPAIAYLIAVPSVVDTQALSEMATGDAIRGLCGSVAFLGCVWGHIFCPWLKFKGGKGIATAFACFFCFAGPIPALIEIALFIVVVAITRYISAGSLAAAILCFCFSVGLFWGNWLAVIFGAMGALAIIWAHRDNIRRLRDGTERRIGEKKKEEQADADVDAGA